MNPMEGASVQFSIPTFVPGDWATNIEADATISANPNDAQRRRNMDQSSSQIRFHCETMGRMQHDCEFYVPTITARYPLVIL
jgi:hypothetical protein